MMDLVFMVIAIVLAIFVSGQVWAMAGVRLGERCHSDSELWGVGFWVVSMLISFALPAICYHVDWLVGWVVLLETTAISILVGIVIQADEVAARMYPDTSELEKELEAKATAEAEAKAKDKKEKANKKEED